MECYLQTRGMQKNDTESIIAAVKNFADEAHGEQMRKYAPDRYIVHPERVMRLVQQYNDDITVLSAALLHDVLEDTPVPKAEIRTFLLNLMSAAEADKTLELVVDLTDVYIKKDFPGLNRRARKDKELQRLEKINPQAQTIKYADIIDNSKEIISEDPDFAGLFLRECRQVLKKLDRGDQALSCLLYTSPSPRD